MRKQIQFIILLQLIFLNFGYSQENNPVLPVNGDLLSSLKKINDVSGGVNISMDPGIEENYYKHLLYNNSTPGVLGFRIRIYRGSGSNAYNEALRARANFLDKFEDVGAYLDFDTPDYFVDVGDCRTWSEALKLHARIKKEYPSSHSYVVPQQAIKVDYSQGNKNSTNE